jgi:hypothetical protein
MGDASFVDVCFVDEQMNSGRIRPQLRIERQARLRI